MLDSQAYAAYKLRLHRMVLTYIVGLISFLLLMAWAEQKGLSRFWLGPIFMFASVMMYAAIGIYGRTTDPEEYYVAGRRIPAMYNGMAAAADWMSAASFISKASAAPRPRRAGWPMCWAGRVGSAWSRFSSRRTCASSISTPCPIIFGSATAAAGRA